MKTPNSRSFLQARRALLDFTAQDKRIPATKLHTEPQKRLHESAWERTGCAMSVDGHNDAAIKPQEMHEYIVPAST